MFQLNRLYKMYTKTLYTQHKLTIDQSSKVRHVMDSSIEQMLVLYHHPMMPVLLQRFDMIYMKQRFGIRRILSVYACAYNCCCEPNT